MCESVYVSCIYMKLKFLITTMLYAQTSQAMIDY